MEATLAVEGSEEELTAAGILPEHIKTDMLLSHRIRVRFNNGQVGEGRVMSYRSEPDFIYDISGNSNTRIEFKISWPHADKPSL